MNHSYSNLTTANVVILPKGYNVTWVRESSSARDALRSIRDGEYLECVRRHRDENDEYKGKTLADTVTEARDKKCRDKTSYDLYKEKMSAVCWAVSEFGKKASKYDITRFSGYVYFDVDKVDDYVEAKGIVLRSRLAPHVVMMWKSVGGKGLGGIVWAPWVKSAEDYRLAYAKADELAGGILDPSCKNADRKNVMSWSPNTYDNYDAEELPRPEAKADIRTVQSVKEGSRSTIATPEQSAKGTVRTVQPVKEGLDLTEDGVAGAPYSRLDRHAKGLSECFGTFLLENGMEPMWDDPRNPYANAYGDAWRARGASPCYSYSFSILNRLRAPYAAAGPARPSDPSSLSLFSDSEFSALRYEEYEDTSYTKKYKLLRETIPFAETVTEPYLVSKEGVPCVQLYLPKLIRKGHRRRILFAFLINYYWKYPERLDLAHTFELVAKMGTRIEGKLEEKKIRDMHKSIQDMADSPDGITPSFTVKHVLFLNKSRIPAKTRRRISNEATGCRRSANTADRIRSFVLGYAGAKNLTAAVVAAGLGIGICTAKTYCKALKREIKEKNEELGLRRAGISRTGSFKEPEAKSDAKHQPEYESSPRVAGYAREDNNACVEEPEFKYSFCDTMKLKSAGRVQN